jgi:hypothetical protein
MEFLTKQEKVTYKTARTKGILNVIIFVFRNNKHINTITLTNKEATNKLINVLIDKARNQNKTKIKINNVCHNIKVEQQKEHYLHDDTIVKYKYIYTFNDIPEKIYLY